MAEIGRLLTAMITPFTDDGDVDYGQARKLAKGLLESGNDGLVIGGTTGEAPSMSDEEKLRLFAEVKEEVGDRGAIVAGTTDNNYRKSVQLSKEAEAVGVDALLLTVPADRPWSSRPGLKTYRKLNYVRTRRMAKVWLHVALSILVLNASAVARIQEGRPDQLRECARRVA